MYRGVVYTQQNYLFKILDMLNYSAFKDQT